MKAVQLLRIKGQVCAKMLEEHEKHEKTLEKLKLELKPCRGVIAAEKFAKGKLRLAPVSSKLEATPRGNCVGLGTIHGHKMWIS